MDKERASSPYRDAERLFEAALELPAEERSGFLEAEIGREPTLLREVVSLLEADGDAGRFLEIPALNAWVELWNSQAHVPGPGDRLGPYEILRPIGEGGMGTVFLAIRADDEYQQQVAIKLANRTASGELLERLRSERQILANLDHPNIARLLDGGSTDSGLPYLVMEYIEGTAIDEYCDRQELSVARRIEIFRSVCAAVQDAHRSLVVHRDLKPQNILITREGVPKLLDFGIAKLLASDAVGDVDLTRTSLRPLTPNYASPEQLRGDAITTSTDVYSLGVLLHRLLTGQLPRVFRSLEPRSIERVLSQEPLLGGLNRDLDNIVRKALRTEPDRRYASVEQLSEDLRRYASGLPVLARPSTLGYRAAKFLRRNRAAVTLGLAVLALLIGFSADKAHQAEELARERDRARVETGKARELATFLVDLLRESDPWNTPGREVTVREVLDRGAEEILQSLGEEPEIRGTLLDTMGTIYLGLALHDKAAPLLEEGLAQRRRVLPENHPDIAASLAQLGLLRYHQGEYDRAIELQRQALAIRRQVLGPEHPSVADSLYDLGLALLLRGEYAESESVHRRALAIRRPALGDDHLKTASSRKQLAIVLTETGDFETAESLFDQALGVQRQQLGDQHPETAATLSHLASLRHRTGDLAGAEKLLREILSLRRHIFGDAHPQVGQAMNNLAIVLMKKGEHEEPEELFRQVFRQMTATLGEHHRDVAVMSANLGKLAQMKGDLAAAESHYRRSLAIVRHQGHPGAAVVLHQLAGLKIQSGAPELAEPLLRDALNLRAAALPEDHPLIAESRGALGRCLVDLGRFAEAEELLLESHRAAVAAGQPEGPALEDLARLYEAWGRPDRATELRSQNLHP